MVIGGDRNRNRANRRPPISIPGKTWVKESLLLRHGGQCVPIREGGEQRAAVNVNSWVTPEFSHFLWLIPER